MTDDLSVPTGPESRGQNNNAAPGSEEHNRAFGWIETYSGRRFWPLDPRAEDVDVVDIAHALSLVCRFGGHPQQFYSVAQHCVIVSDCFDDVKMETHGLLHDAAEAYFSDIVRPVKRLIQGIDVIEQRIIEAIYGMAGIDPPTDEEYARIKEIDTRLLMAERRDLMRDSGNDWGVRLEPLGFKITPWSWEKAKITYLDKYENLMNRLGH